MSIFRRVVRWLMSHSVEHLQYSSREAAFRRRQNIPRSLEHSRVALVALGFRDTLRETTRYPCYLPCTLAALMMKG